MATIERISKETYRITKMYKGKRYRMTVDRKPSKQEAERLIWSMIEKEPSNPIYKTFAQTVVDYCDNKSSILSPGTIKTYYAYLRVMPETFKNAPISGITNETIQIMLNEYASAHNAKTTHNLKVFIGLIIHSVNEDFKLKVKTPPIQKSDFYVPEDSDINALLDAEKGSPHEIAVWLAVLGLRRSEICALETSDLSKHNIITVNKSMVKDKDNKWITKVTKTIESTRKIPCPEYVAELIRALPEGKIYRMHPETLNNHIKRLQSKLGINVFSPHKFRHYFASTAREVMPDGYVEKLGGWKPGSDIMKKVYDYTKKKQEKEAADALLKRLGKLSG